MRIEIVFGVIIILCLVLLVYNRVERYQYLNYKLLGEMGGEDQDVYRDVDLSDDERNKNADYSLLLGANRQQQQDQEPRRMPNLPVFKLS